MPNETKPSKSGRAGATGKKRGSARAAFPLRWTATEYAPRKHWWWFAITGLIALYVAVFLWVVGNWSFALVVVVATVALFRWYLPKPRVFDYELTKTELRIASGKVVRRLDRYQSFSLERIPQGKKREPFELVVLWPKARFGAGFDVYLPEDPGEFQHVVVAFASVVAATSGASMRWLDRLARLLNLE